MSTEELQKLKKIKHMTISKMSCNELVNQMSGAVFGAKRIALATDIAEKMIKDKDCTVFIGVAGPMVPGGMRNILIDMLQNNYVNVLVVTGATLVHDLIESLGHYHYQGSSIVDDADLNKKGIDRIYESYMSNDVYEDMEKFIDKNWDSLAEKKRNIKEFLWHLGSLTPTDKGPSILRTCYENKIPIFCPALADCGIGLMIWGQLAKGRKLEVSAFDDLKDILDIAWDCKKSGIIYIGGGVPKNYIQQAMQFSPKAAEYGIQLTTDRPESGGSSGAPLREAISWGKLNKDADFVDVICDATISVPLIYAALKERL